MLFWWKRHVEIIKVSGNSLKEEIFFIKLNEKRSLKQLFGKYKQKILIVALFLIKTMLSVEAEEHNAK